MCDCGERRSVLGTTLIRGDSTSCGCSLKGNTYGQKHGHRKGGKTTSEYQSWRSMIARCTDPNSTSWPSYGARGIKIYPKWRQFEAFLSDMGPKPSASYTIEREDRDKGYSPSNCRWATPKEQALNRHTTRRVVLNGDLVPLVEAAEQHGLAPATVKARIQRGWTPQQAMSTPPRSKGGDNTRGRPRVPRSGATAVPRGILSAIDAMLAERSTPGGGLPAPTPPFPPNYSHNILKREFTSWAQMRFRCSKHPRYAGRGISVCDRWQLFAAFLADMGLAPLGRSLDRINTNGNYEPGNCRWSTDKEQQNNRWNTIRIDVEGRSISLSDLAEIAGMPPPRLIARLKGGWTVAEAITTTGISAANIGGRRR